MSDLAKRLVEVAYVADGGELPKMANHLALHRAKYEAIAVALLRELAANGFLECHLEVLADEIEAA
jgi:hypothetical protein